MDSIKDPLKSIKAFLQCNCFAIVTYTPISIYGMLPNYKEVLKK